jgi:hypothetical protein
MQIHFAEQSGETGGWRAWPHIRYFLREYEVGLGGDVGDLSTVRAVYPGPNATVSHEWSRLFERFSDQRKQDLASTLGNLVYLRRRVRSSSSSRRRAVRRTSADHARDSFEYRKEHQIADGEYDGFAYGSENEKEVAAHAQWGPSEILTRGVKMLRFMSERWDMPLNEERCKTLTKVNFVGDFGDANESVQDTMR